MKSTTIIAALCAIGGCLAVRPAEPALCPIGGCLPMVPAQPVIEEQKFQNAFGDVPIVESGMTSSEIDRLMKGYGRSWSAYGLSNSYLYSCGLHVNMSDGKVADDCYFLKQTAYLPQPKNAIADADLRTILHSGMAPKEVEEKIGYPSCGYCNKPGTVALLYDRQGIEVEFVGERLLKWRRVVTYKDETTPKAP